MRKTLLLVFIHGFKGGDDTFENFPEHLRVLVSDALPKITVTTAVYPRFETRGELTGAVSRFKEWLENKVIDLEVAAGTPSPTVDPSVRVILVGHSMGGIVAAETLLSIAQDKPISASGTATDRPHVTRNQTSAATNATAPSHTQMNVPEPPERPTSAPPTAAEESRDGLDGAAPIFFFPYIQGILAFDTPYLGVHPGVVAHGAESHYNTATAAYSAYTSASKFFGFGGNTSAAAGAASNSAKALPSAGQASGGRGAWGKYAMFAGGAAALAGAAAGAYYTREHISSGWNWVGSHLAFVGCLARGAELSQRVESVVKLSERHGIGFVDFYTRLGKSEGKTKVAGQLLGEERTFCVVPREAKEQDRREGSSSTEVEKRKKGFKGTWIEAVNTESSDEVTAHRAMFTPKDHPGYYGMSDRARNLVVDWVDKGWYEASDDVSQETHEEHTDGGL